MLKQSQHRRVPHFWRAAVKIEVEVEVERVLVALLADVGDSPAFVVYVFQTRLTILGRVLNVSCVHCSVSDCEGKARRGHVV